MRAQPRAASPEKPAGHPPPDQNAACPQCQNEGLPVSNTITSTEQVVSFRCQTCHFDWEETVSTPTVDLADD